MAQERVVMEATERTLLRLHVEAVWGVRLPSLSANEVELLHDELPALLETLCRRTSFRPCVSVET